MGELADRAERLAEHLLAASLPRRWRHVQAVAIKAGRISAGLPADDVEMLVASACCTTSAMSQGWSRPSSTRLMERDSFAVKVFLSVYAGLWRIIPVPSSRRLNVALKGIWQRSLPTSIHQSPMRSGTPI